MEYLGEMKKRACDWCLTTKAHEKRYNCESFQSILLSAATPDERYVNLHRLKVLLDQHQKLV